MVWNRGVKGQSLLMSLFLASAVSATPPSQNMGNTPAGVDSACVSPEKDEQGGKLSSSNMLEQLAKTYQGKPSSPSGMSY